MRKTIVKNILTNTLAAYSNMSEEDQYAISLLALQLEKVNTNSHDSSTVTNKSGLSVVVPSNACIATQPKNRLAPLRESMGASALLGEMEK